jgi:hypothetical protein
VLGTLRGNRRVPCLDDGSLTIVLRIQPIFIINPTTAGTLFLDRPPKWAQSPAHHRFGVPGTGG